MAPGESVTYWTVHRRLAEQYGPASLYDCACGRPAVQWAYTGPREPGERLPFSPDLSLYEAMCLRCHSRFDRASVKAAVKYPEDARLF